MKPPRGRALYRSALFCCVGGGIALAYFYPAGPLLAWWLLCALGFGVYLSYTDAAVDLAERAERIVVLSAILIPAGLVTTHLAARRSSAATHLRFHGVLVERADSITVGSGVPGVDVVLPMVSRSQVPWRLTLRRTAGGWEIDGKIDAEQVRVSPVRGLPSSPSVRLARLLRLRREPFTVANGALLLDGGAPAVIRDRARRVIDTLSLVTADERLALRSGAAGVRFLEPTNRRLASRYEDRLYAGTSLASLDGGATGTLATRIPLDRFIRVQELAPQQDVNANWPGISSQLLSGSVTLRRFLVTSSAPFSIESLSPANPRGPIVLGDSARIEVRHGGGRWRFDAVAMRRVPSALPGLAVKFVRNPRVLDWPLPGAGACLAGNACGVLSLRVLPPPVGHITLAAAGLDTSRFALLARLRETPRGVQVALGSRSVPVSRGAISAIPATTLVQNNDGGTVASLQEPSHWLLLSASASRFEGLTKLIPMCLGLVCLLLAASGMVRFVGGAGQRPYARTEQPLSLALTTLLALMLTRLIVGSRVTFFPPFKDAGLDTALGIYIAVATVTTGLLFWSAWAPRLLILFDAVALYPDRASSHSSPARRATARPGRSARRRRASVTWLAAGLVVAFAALGAVSLAAVTMGLVVGVLVLSTWFILAWLSAFHGRQFHAFEQSPSDVVEFDVTATGAAKPGVVASLDDPPRERGKAWRLDTADRAIVVLAYLWAITLWLSLVGIVTSLAILIVNVVRAVTRRAAGEQRAALRRRVMGSLGAFISVAAIAAIKWGSENGALATFLLVILVALTSVRIGRSLAAHLGVAGPSAADGGTLPTHYTPALAHAALPAGQRARIPWWVITLYLLAPLAMLAPLAAIDMGLLLITMIPIGAAALLAVGWRRVPVAARLAVAGVALAGVGLLSEKVLFPPLGAIRNPSSSYAERAQSFDRMQRVLGFPVRVSAIRRSLERAAARGVATADQRAAERLLVAAYPGGARDLLMPSIEQVWGGRAYAAAGPLGKGIGQAPIGGHGIAEPVSYAENSFAVYILHEHGAVGGVILLFTYLAFGVAVLLAIRGSVKLSQEAGRVGASLRASRALFLVAALLVTIPAAYVALSNLGIVSITGQNMPFLGLNAWSDVTLCAGVAGMLLTGAMRTQALQRTVE